LTSFVWSLVGRNWIKSIKANYAFLDELQDQRKWEGGMRKSERRQSIEFGSGKVPIADFGLRIYENLEGVNRIDRALSKNKVQIDMVSSSLTPNFCLLTSVF
jgi:hypothetical protein